jgi:hypothetical protein
MKIDNNTSRFVSLADIAEDLGAARSTVRAWLDEAELEPYTFSRSRNAKMFFRRCDIDTWIESAIEEDDEDLEDDDDEEEFEDDEELEDDEDLEDDQDDQDDEDDDDEGLEDDELEGGECDPVGVDVWVGHR